MSLRKLCPYATVTVVDTFPYHRRSNLEAMRKTAAARVKHNFLHVSVVSVA